MYQQPDNAISSVMCPVCNILMRPLYIVLLRAMGPLEMPAHFLTMVRICYPYNDTCMRLFDNIGVISGRVFQRMVEILLKRFWNAFSWYNIFCIWFKSSHIVFASQEAMWYWPNSQIPQCTCSISHNATFRTEMCTFLFWMMHWGIWNNCIVGIVRLAYCCCLLRLK